MKTHIMLHHSLTKDGQTVSWPAIEKYHREVQAWRDIGYHAGIELVTDNPELALYDYQGMVGRAARVQASACPQGDMNRIGLHLCFVGNFDLAPPPQEMLERAMLRFVRPWMLDFNISPDRIIGHRDYNPHKSCPGTKFDIEVVRRMVR